jgi:hypothetical protein
MIDRDTGALVLPDGHVGRDLTRTAFLASPTGQASRAAPMGTGWTHFDVGEHVLGTRTFGARLSFEGEQLDGYTVWLVDARYGTSWNDASEEKELARRDAHDAWLIELLGTGRRGAEPGYSFAWGEVWSSYDVRSSSSTIGVRFQRTRPSELVQER